MQATISPPKGLSAIAVGTLTEIVSIFTDIVPLAGDQVKVTVAVKNISSESLYISCGTALYDGAQLTFSPDYLWVEPGDIVPFTASFTMPNKDVRLHVGSFYWTGTEWIDDDYGYIDIVLEEVPPTEGKVQNLEITEWESPVEIGGRCRIQVGFEYVGPKTTRILRAAIGHQYPLWFNEKVYKELTITISERAEIRKSYYFIDIPITAGDIDPAESPFDLYAKVDGIFPEAISPIYEDVITVTAPPVEYTGLIVFCDMYKSPEGQIPFPATVTANNEYFKVFFDCRNTSAVTLRVGVEMKVYDPTGLRAAPTIDWFDLKSFQTLESEYNNFCRVDKVGVWRIEARFLEQSTSAVLDEKTFTMTATAVEYAGTITKKQLTYDETIGIIPVTADAPIFSRGIVTVLGRNDMTTTQQMGITWTVNDPEGYEVEHYSAWEAWPYCPPGDEHKFDGGRFDLEKPGDWTINIELLMNRDSPVVVDSYDGLLCSVSEEVLPPGYNFIQHTIYHFAYIYDGDDEVTTATFRIDPFTPSAWATEKLAEKVKTEAEKMGSRVLELKAYADTRPLLWTDIKIDLTATPIGGVTAAGVGAIGIPLWASVLIIALAAIGVIVAITLSIKTIVGLFQHKPGLEDVKVAWGKEALILDIHDAEEYWERTLTPLETLEGMSEQELRDILDQIAEEEVPEAEFPWALVAVGAVGVLGVGAAIALAPRKG